MLPPPAALVVENTRHPILGGGAGASADQMSAKHEREERRLVGFVLGNEVWLQTYKLRFSLASSTLAIRHKGQIEGERRGRRLFHNMRVPGGHIQMPSHRKFVRLLELHMNVPSCKVHSLNVSSRQVALSQNVPSRKTSLDPFLLRRHI